MRLLTIRPVFHEEKEENKQDRPTGQTKNHQSSRSSTDNGGNSGSGSNITTGGNVRAEPQFSDSFGFGFPGKRAREEKEEEKEEWGIQCCCFNGPYPAKKFCRHMNLPRFSVPKWRSPKSAKKSTFFV